MRHDLVEHLACPTCRRPLQAAILEGTRHRIERGLLSCDTCQVSVPVLHGFPIFHEQLLGGRAPEDALAELDTRLFGSRREVEAFLRAKRRRPTVGVSGLGKQSPLRQLRSRERVRRVGHPGALAARTRPFREWSGAPG